MNVVGYLREIEVLIGPLEEWRGGGSETVALRLYADGTRENLRMRFRVAKHIITTSQPTTVEVYNLSQGTRNALRKSGTLLVLRAGYRGEMVEIFRGSVVQVLNRKQGADIVTTIYALAAFSGLVRTAVSQTFGAGETLKTAVLWFAGKINGVTVDAGKVKLKEVSFGAQGWSWPGPVGEGLDHLARTYGFSWGVDDGVFFALDDENGAALPGNAQISQETGLLRAEPSLASPYQTVTGLQVRCVLNPWVKPGHTFDLKSVVNPGLNGTYKAHTVEHTGDSHGDTWETNIEHLPTGDKIVQGIL